MFKIKLLIIALLLIAGCTYPSHKKHVSSKINISDRTSVDIDQSDIIVVKGIQSGEIHQYVADDVQAEALKTIAYMFANGCFTHSIAEKQLEALFLREGEQLFGWDLSGRFVVEFYEQSEIKFDMYFFFDVNWSSDLNAGRCAFIVLVNEDIETVRNIDEYYIPDRVVLSGDLNYEWNKIIRSLIVRPSLSENTVPRKP